MLLHSRLLAEHVQFTVDDSVLMLNSAQDPLVPLLARRLRSGKLTLAEDNVAVQHEVLRSLPVTAPVRHVAFHDYILHHEPATVDIAAMNLLYQPGKSWVHYGLQVALYALRSGGSLYVTGAKDRGILSVAKYIKEIFGNMETVEISKGHRVLRAICDPNTLQVKPTRIELALQIPAVFASNKLDEGTALLLEALQIQPDEQALDLGCGAGWLGLHIARTAIEGHVVMVDASLAAVMVAQQAVAEQGLSNIEVLDSDSADAVRKRRFSLVVTNPPFHQAGIQTTAIAERFIRDAAHVLLPDGRFYLVANRFLKYEKVLQSCFGLVREVAGDNRYKVLLATHPVSSSSK